jgi:hypothetical protein
MMRQWLSGVIAGNTPIWPAAADTKALIACADEEGISALLHERICSDAALAEQIPLEFRDGIAKLAREKALHSLVREHECRRLLGMLAQANLPVLLLKGTALAYWAYEAPHLRERGDIDLLFRSKNDVDQVVKLLEEQKFELVELALPGDLISFEVTCRRSIHDGAPLEIDLHWHLSNTPMFAFRFGFDELARDGMALPKLAPNAFGLAPIPAYLHACMHRIQNMTINCENTLRWLYDLHVLGLKFNADDWDKLATLAAEKKLAGVCVDGMQAAAECFGVLAPRLITEQLIKAAKQESMDVSKMDRWFYIQRMNFLAYPSLRLRLRWLRQRLLPNINYMRIYYGQDQGLWQMLVSRLRGSFSRLRR